MSASSAFHPPVRSLPDRPNLDYERKAAKRLLRAWQEGDSAAVGRAAALKLARESPQLSDAQLVIAREYGFASWPRLVEYFGRWEAHIRVQPARATYGVDWYERDVAETLSLHQRRFWSGATALAAYVPTCFGKTDAEIFDTPITEADARLSVARRNGFANWAALVSAAGKVHRDESLTHADTPLGRAWKVVGDGVLDEVRRLVELHPELLHPATSGIGADSSIANAALWHEREKQTAAARAITDWIASVGGNVQQVLNESLKGDMRAGAEQFEWLIARGADPHWSPPNGISLLEHVMLRCWNPGPLDVIARYQKPRAAFWIAAGMNDTTAMARYFNADGSLTDAARNDRADFVAVGAVGRLPMRPNVPDHDILFEASLVAAMNHRFDALDLLYERGLPIDYSPWVFNIFHWAAGNARPEVVEFLLLRGANADLMGFMPNKTPRQMALDRLESDRASPAAQQVAEMLGVA